MLHLTLIRGLPGSGKSTLAKVLRSYHRQKQRDVKWYEADMYFTNPQGQYKFDPKKISHAHAWCKFNTEKAMSNYVPQIIVSNTFTQHWEMKPYLDMAEKYGYTVSVIKCEGPWENVHGVPESKVEQMRNRWED